MRTRTRALFIFLGAVLIGEGASMAHGWQRYAMLLFVTLCGVYIYTMPWPEFPPVPDTPEELEP